MSRYHHGNLRQALIEAAIPVLKDKGIVGLSLRKLATDVGVSHGAPYRHFHDKTALLEAIAVTGFQALEALCRRAVRDYPDDPRRQLYEAGIGYIFYVVRNPEIAELMFKPGLSRGDRNCELQQAIDAAVAGLAEIIENGRRERLYGEYETTDLVLTSLSTVHGLAMFIAGGMLTDADSSKKKIEALGTRVYTLLMQGMEGRNQKHDENHGA